MKYSFRLSLIALVATIVCTTSHAAENKLPPADNDESYKLPLFIPKVAQPTGGKVIFEDNGRDNDEIYSLPKRAAAKPSSLSPSAGASTAAQKNYNQQYEEYQRQMKVYNEQMAEYKKQLAAQQAAQSAGGSDNDSNYVLPEQYSNVKKNIKPPPAAPKPKAQPVATPQVTQPIAVQQPVAAPVRQQSQPQYTPPPATNNNTQYNQKYNYSDQEKAPASTDLPNYYY